jgi:hypothetical protein
MDNKQKRGDKMKRVPKRAKLDATLSIILLYDIITTLSTFFNMITFYAKNHKFSIYICTTIIILTNLKYFNTYFNTHTNKTTQ